MTAGLPWLPCPHRTAGDPPRCGHRIRRGMIVLPSMCAACPILPRATPAPAPPAAAELLPCTLRGPLLREELCRRGCRSERALIPVHVCPTHGECSVRRIARDQPMACCLDCSDRVP